MSGGPDERPEPDYRFTLANERTFLAWIRTALGLLAAGLASHFLEGTVTTGRQALSIGAIVLGGLCVVNGYLRWNHVQHAIERGEPLPAAHGIRLLAASLLAVALVALVLVAVD